MSSADKSAKTDVSLTASFYEKRKKINLKILNTTEEPLQYSVKVEGMELLGDSVVNVSSENYEVAVVVRVPPESGKKGVNTICFDVKAMHSDKIAVHEKASFLVP